MDGAGGFGCGGGILDVEDVDVFFVGFRGPFEDLRGDDGDVTVAIGAEAVFFAACEGGSQGFALRVSGGGDEFWGGRDVAAGCYYIRVAATFLVRGGFGEGGGFGGWGDGFLGFLCGDLRGPFDFLGEVEAGSGDPFCRAMISGWR